jgi:hypothetical protein
MRIWPCWSGGNALMMRSTVEEAVVVCSVAEHEVARSPRP